MIGGWLAPRLAVGEAGVLGGIACLLRCLAGCARLRKDSFELRAERLHLGFVSVDVEAVVAGAAVVDAGRGALGTGEESAVHADLLSAQT